MWQLKRRQAQATLLLTLKQLNRPTPGQTDKAPLPIPVATGLLVDGKPIPLDSGTTRILELSEPEQTFTFDGVVARPVASLLRGFSAPVRLTADQSESDLLTLMSGDDDDFVDAAGGAAGSKASMDTKSDVSNFERCFLLAGGVLKTAFADGARSRTLLRR